MQTPEGLTSLLTLKQLDAHRFEGENYQTVWQRVYGGQVFSSSTACRTSNSSWRSFSSLITRLFYFTWGYKKQPLNMK